MERTSKGALYVDLALFGLSAAFAGITALLSTLEPHRVWGGIAVGGYIPATVVVLMLLMRYAVPVLSRVWLTVAAGAAVTVMPLLAMAVQRAGGTTGRAQEEVLVVESAGVRLLETGTPYLSIDQIAEHGNKLLAYNPYQPGMSIFGIPRALLGIAWYTDARIWFAVATIAALGTALQLLHRAGLSRGAWIRGLQAVLVLPFGALTLATGGDDLPVVALCLLAFAAVTTDRYWLAGFAIGGAAALKLLALPVLVVILVLVWKRNALKPVAVVAVPLAVLPTVLFARPADYIANVLAFPLGDGLVESPAASPLPGHLIAEYLPAGRIVAIVLLLAAAAVMGFVVLTRPPATAHRAAALSAIGLLAAIALLPATRFGYLLYPAVFGVWWWVLRESEAPRPQWGRHTQRIGDPP